MNANQSTVRRPLGIFWDIENCCIPLTKSASGVAERIRQFIADRHPECAFANQFTCCCDSKRLSEDISEGLNRNGVIVVHVSSSAKNASDDKLQELIDVFVDNFIDKNPLLVVITSDINFAKPIRNARRKAVDVLLIHGQLCSQDLKNSVKETYLYSDVIRDVENRSMNRNELKPAYLKVWGLPEDRPTESIVKRMARLASNCGGKAENLCNGKALIGFLCRDDAQRCLQRISGSNIFGHRIDVKLIAEELKHSTEVQDFNICKAVISGLESVSAQEPIESVLKMITDWKDSQINAELISKVEVQENGDLIVTAISPDANQKLLNSAENHLSSDSAIVWNQLQDYDSTTGLGLGWSWKRREYVSDDCLSVIKGLETRSDDNFTKMVKKLVDDWNDRDVGSDCIVLVERNSKQKLSNGKINLFVRATSAQTSKDLVMGAKRNVDESSGIKWTQYTHKFQYMYDDCKSVIKGLNTRSDENITEKVRQIVNDWNDSKITGNLIKSVERNTKQSEVLEGKVNLFVTAINATASEALIRGAKQYIRADHQIKWTYYDHKDVLSRSGSTSNADLSDSDISECSYYSTSSSVHTNEWSNRAQNLNQSLSQRNAYKADNSPNSDTLSVIEGLWTEVDDNVTKIVRKLVINWNDNKINSNFIRTVDRDQKNKNKNGKIRLFVTTWFAHQTKALVAGAHKYQKPNDGIVWTPYANRRQTEDKVKTRVRPKQSNGLQNSAPNQNPLLPNPSHFYGHSYLLPEPLRTNPIPPLYNLNPMQQNMLRLSHPMNPFYYPMTQYPALSTLQAAGRPRASADNKVSFAQKSVIKGLNTKCVGEDVTNTVRIIVLGWKDYRIGSNFIASVERDPKRRYESGDADLIVTAIDAYCCQALVSAAQRHLKANSGIVWTHYDSSYEPSRREEPRRVSQARAAVHPSSMFVICGHSSKHTDDVLQSVRLMIILLNDKRLSADDVIAVTRDCKWKSRDGTAMLFVTASDKYKKQLILNLANGLDSGSNLEFKDYNGFKHN